MTCLRTFALVMLALCTFPAAANTWRLADGSTFTFATSFEGAPLEGRFTEFDVTFDFDPQQPGASLLQVTVHLAGADMGDPDMNEAIAAPEWFDVGRFPQARFESDDIAETAPGSFVARGVLALKGIKRRVDVPFAWSGSQGEATMQGELTIKRSDFDVGSGEWASGEQIGIDVSLRFSLQLQRAN